MRKRTKKLASRMKSRRTMRRRTTFEVLENRTLLAGDLVIATDGQNFSDGPAADVGDMRTLDEATAEGDLGVVDHQAMPTDVDFESIPLDRRLIDPRLIDQWLTGLVVLGTTSSSNNAGVAKVSGSDDAEVAGSDSAGSQKSSEAPSTLTKTASGQDTDPSDRQNGEFTSPQFVTSPHAGALILIDGVQGSYCRVAGENGEPCDDAQLPGKSADEFQPWQESGEIDLRLSEATDRLANEGVSGPLTSPVEPKRPLAHPRSAAVDEFDSDATHTESDRIEPQASPAPAGEKSSGEIEIEGENDVVQEFPNKQLDGEGVFIAGKGGRPVKRIMKALPKAAEKLQDLEIREKLEDQIEKLGKKVFDQISGKFPNEFRAGNPTIVDGQMVDPKKLLDEDAFVKEFVKVFVNHPFVGRIVDKLVEVSDLARNQISGIIIDLIPDGDGSDEVLLEPADAMEKSDHSAPRGEKEPEADVDTDFNIRPRFDLDSQGIKHLKAKFKIKAEIPGFGTIKSKVRGKLEEPFGDAELETRIDLTIDLSSIPLDFSGRADAKISDLYESAALDRFSSSFVLGLDLSDRARIMAGVDYERQGSNDLIRGRAALQLGHSSVDLAIDSEGDHRLTINLLNLELGVDREIPEDPASAESLLPPGFQLPPSGK